MFHKRSTDGDYNDTEKCLKRGGLPSTSGAAPSVKQASKK